MGVYDGPERRGDNERLATLEADVKNICTNVDKLAEGQDRLAAGQDDLAKLIANYSAQKADKEEVKALRDLFTGIVIAVAAFAITTLVGLAIWAFQTLATN